jgi:hypothetical protein
MTKPLRMISNDEPARAPEVKPISPVIEDYDQLVAALKRRRMDLGLSLLEAEAIGGFTTSHLTKLETYEAAGYGRRAGPFSLTTWLGALGVGLQLVELPHEHPFHRERKPPADQSKFRKKHTGLPDNWNAA